MSAVFLQLPQPHCQAAIQKPALPTTSTLPSPILQWGVPRNWAESWSLGTWVAMASGTSWDLRKGVSLGTSLQVLRCISLTPNPQVNTKLRVSTFERNSIWFAPLLPGQGSYIPPQSLAPRVGIWWKSSLSTASFLSASFLSPCRGVQCSAGL